MQKLFHNNSIKRFIVLFILFFTIVPSVLATIFSYFFTTNLTKNNYTANYMEAIFLEMEDNISLIINQITNNILNITGHQMLSTILYDNALTFEQKQQGLNEILSKIISEKSFIVALDIITKNGDIFRYGKNDFESKALDDEYLSNLKRTTFFIGNDCIKTNNNYYFYIGKKIYNYSTGFELGSAIIYLDESTISSVYNDSIPDESTFFISIDKKIISHPDKTFLGSVLYLPQELIQNTNDLADQSSKYLFSTYPIINKSISNKVQISCVISNRALHSTLNKLISYILLSLFLVAILSVFLALIFSNRLVNKITRLKDSMNLFAKDYKKEVQIKPSNEISVLEISFNQMASDINKLIEQIALEKEKQRIAEINLLQSQINPHFIYNALDAISWKAKSNMQYEIDEMLIALASFFRVGLHKGDNYIKIKDEIQHAKSYLTIEQIRFPQLFDVKFEIAEEILEYYTIKIILQPIIENSIKHAFKNIDYKGLIILRGYFQDENNIIFEIEDNGIGTELPADYTLPKSKNTLGGYGLYNVNERLRIEYGEGYNLSFMSRPNGGTLVTIRIKKKNSLNNSSKMV